MTIFFICAALLVVICLLWLLTGLFRANRTSTDQEAVNIALARERRVTLDAAIADGSIDQTTYEYEREQLEHDLASDLRPESQQPTTHRNGQIAAAVLVAVFVPIAAGALYLHLGNPAAITQSHSAEVATSSQNGSNAQNAATGAQAPALADLLPQLEERLSNSPDDLDGWRLLGRSYLSVNEFGRAQAAFEKALALDDNDVTTMAQLAESIAMSREGDLTGEPLTLLTRSNQLDPSHEHTLWLLSIARQQVGDHEGALAGFDQLAIIAKDNPQAQSTIEQMRSRSVQALSVNPGRQTNEENANNTVPDTQQPQASISVTVSLNESAQASANPEHAVFIYAKASNGPPMPLAVSRITVKDLPTTVTLDDSMAMIPTMKLSSFENVTVGARVSASGNPIAQSGDWFSEQRNINVEDVSQVTLTIDQQAP